MADKVRINTDFLIYSGTNTNNPNDLNKLGNSFEKEIKESSRLKIQLAAEEAMTIPLPDATCNYIMIFSDQNIDLGLNGAENMESLVTLKAGIKAPVFMKACEITQVGILNPSTTKVANLDIFIIKI